MTQERRAQSVLVIDDHALIRKGVSQLVDMSDDLVMAGEAESGMVGLDLARRLQPDVILLDLNMKGITGMQTLHALKGLGLDARVLVLTVSDSDRDVVEALRAGADGYLLKDMEPEELMETLRTAASGRLVLSPAVANLLVEGLREETRPQCVDAAHLTEREGEILGLLAGGLSNKLIGRELGISEGTVKIHMKHLLKKLNLRSRTEAAVWAVEHGCAVADKN